MVDPSGLQDQHYWGGGIWDPGYPKPQPAASTMPAPSGGGIKSWDDKSSYVGTLEHVTNLPINGLQTSLQNAIIDLRTLYGGDLSDSQTQQSILQRRNALYQAYQGDFSMLEQYYSPEGSFSGMWGAFLTQVKAALANIFVVGNLLPQGEDSGCPATPAPRPIPSIQQRLGFLYSRLSKLPPATSAEDALEQIRMTLNEVEDMYSGVAAQSNPPLVYEGRMYPPQSDFTIRNPDGSIIARTAGHTIEISPTGGIQIISRGSGAVQFTKPGGR